MLAVKWSGMILAVKHRNFSLMLRGGDRRSIGSANELAALVLKEPESFPQLIECLWSDDPVVRMRGADAAEKVSLQRPDLLKPFKAELLGLADETIETELHWHLALMIPRLTLGRLERETSYCEAAGVFE
ncbi:MAG: hypothetical protein WB992_24420 [Bryobacteraceae bacterium]